MVTVVIVTNVELRIWRENHLTYFSIPVLARHGRGTKKMSPIIDLNDTQPEYET